jgi:G:T-mismatch repair DNA endonuclease (very short patch repair protein)
MASTPSTRRTFWAAKFRGNKKRDAIKASQLRAAGWRVVTVWECQTRSETTLSRWLAGVLKRHTRPQRAKQERVKRKLLEGLDSGPPIRVTAAYWNKLRRRVARKAAGK